MLTAWLASILLVQGKTPREQGATAMSKTAAALDTAAALEEAARLVEQARALLVSVTGRRDARRIQYDLMEATVKTLGDDGDAEWGDLATRIRRLAAHVTL
jgi:hypothetical protein